MTHIVLITLLVVAATWGVITFAAGIASKKAQSRWYSAPSLPTEHLATADIIAGVVRWLFLYGWPTYWLGRVFGSS